jgi:hypothetical protein
LGEHEKGILIKLQSEDGVFFITEPPNNLIVSQERRVMVPQ